MKTSNRLIYALMIMLTFSACTGEDEIKGEMSLTNPFTVSDDLNDSIQHKRFEIYEKYGVPVYFNDTIAKTDQGLDRNGAPVIQYETIDLNWGFESYNRDTKYKYDYIASDTEKMQALKFVDKFLQNCSKPMRPFSIMLADTLTVKTTSKTTKPQYHVGFRTVVFTQLKDINSDAKIDSLSQSVINNMVKDKVAANANVCEQFAEVSSKNHYYNKNLKIDDNPHIQQLLSINWTFSLSCLYDDPPFHPIPQMRNIRERLVEEGHVPTIDKAYELVDGAVRELGNWGFIHPSRKFDYYSPGSADEDREIYLEGILYLGEKRFEERYGSMPLVMKKYTILKNYIKNVLGVQLNGEKQ